MNVEMTVLIKANGSQWKMTPIDFVERLEQCVSDVLKQVTKKGERRVRVLITKHAGPASKSKPLALQRLALQRRVA